MVGMGLVKAYRDMRLSYGLSFVTCRAPVGEMIDVPKHLWPKVALRERGERLVASEVSH